MVELMTVLAIAAVLLAVGVPSFNALIKIQRISTTANNFFAAVNLTRSEAIQRGIRVDLVPADGTNWENGWIVLIDRNGNQKADPGEQIIFSTGPVPPGITIKSSFTDSKRPYLAYNGTGRTRTNANSQTPQLGSWSFTLDDHARRIVINFLGRPRVCNPKVETTTC
ncbi:MAG: pilus assembly protein FimT [Burkholderiales bacterium RIFCSPLOWO2_02_FULL_57_36]|nr:MAG: pilus assembly protein FimT [Burkholderiales bacterium RIFCSPLOWO2_02_FULL_57_36]